MLFSPQTSFISKLNKIGKNTRSSYYNKLVNKNLLNSKPKKINNIFIFDWDDTLLCTSVLSPNGYFDDDFEIPEATLKKIKTLEIHVKNILVKALEKGDTYIITNSELDWIEYSCQRFFPNVYELIKKIKIISARDLYEKKYPHDYKIWKVKVFNDIIANKSFDDFSEFKTDSKLFKELLGCFSKRDTKDKHLIILLKILIFLSIRGKKDVINDCLKMLFSVQVFDFIFIF